VPGPENADVRECSCILEHSRIGSIHGVISKRLLAVLLRELCLQAIDLIYKSATVHCKITKKNMTDHGFYAFEIENIVGIAIIDEGPYAGIYYSL
jgi:hypothetical protein